MRSLALMLRRFVLAAVAALGVCAAALGDPFTVSGVSVDERAANATQAQRQALTVAQTLAADRLIQRLTLPEDRLEGALAPITPQDAAELVSGIEIADEQRSSTRYIATVTVSFDPRAVRRYFERFGVPFVQAQARRTFVAPVTEGPNGLTLVSDWSQAWLEGGFEHALTPMVGFGARRDASGAPLGADLLSARAALNGDLDALAAVAALYGAERILVAGARVGAGGATAASGRLFTRDGAGWTSEDIPTAVSNEGVRDAAQLMVGRLEEAWKRQVVVRGGREREMALTVLFGGHGQWRRIQSALTNASLISDARLDGLSSTGAAMTVRYRGSETQLAAELRALGLSLEGTGPLGWTVREP